MAAAFAGHSAGYSEVHDTMTPHRVWEEATTPMPAPHLLLCRPIRLWPCCRWWLLSVRGLTARSVCRRAPALALRHLQAHHHQAGPYVCEIICNGFDARHNHNSAGVCDLRAAFLWWLQQAGGSECLASGTQMQAMMPQQLCLYAASCQTGVKETVPVRKAGSAREQARSSTHLLQQRGHAAEDVLQLAMLAGDQGCCVLLVC